jgi:DNA-binding MarR family transcriptional regulator
MRLVQETGGDVTPEMWTVLIRLMARDGQSQSELAAATYRDRPNMTRILAGLESRGLVTRRPDAEDRRLTHVYLTPEARGLIAATTPVATRARDRMYAGLSRKQLADLRAALRRIESNAVTYLEELKAEEEAPPG